MAGQSAGVAHEELRLRALCRQDSETLPEEVFWLLAEAADELVPAGRLPVPSPTDTAPTDPREVPAALEAVRDRLRVWREQSGSVPEVMACARACRLIGQAVQLLAAEPAR